MKVYICDIVQETPFIDSAISKVTEILSDQMVSFQGILLPANTDIIKPWLKMAVISTLIGIPVVKMENKELVDKVIAYLPMQRMDTLTMLAHSAGFDPARSIMKLHNDTVVITGPPMAQLISKQVIF